MVIRCRGIILDEGELLIVTHPGANYYALPGGKLEYGEDVISCMKREMLEELGIEPEIGRLVYVNNFTTDRHTTEFLFEILNAKEYRDYESKVRTHAFELAGLKWIKSTEASELLPKRVAEDFAQGTLLQNCPKFIKD